MRYSNTTTMNEFNPAATQEKMMYELFETMIHGFLQFMNKYMTDIKKSGGKLYEDVMQDMQSYMPNIGKGISYSPLESLAESNYAPACSSCDK